MTWSELLANRRVAGEKSSKQEVDELLALVARNLKDASASGLSSDGQYEFAYNAMRTLATIVIRACGYRVKSSAGGHYFTFLALEAADPAFAGQSAMGDAARQKGNDFSYESAGIVSDTEAQDLLAEVAAFRESVRTWLAAKHPELL